MSLLDRMRARLCAFDGCEAPRSPDSALCRDHLAMLNRNQLDCGEDGSYVARRRFPPRDLTGDLRGVS